MITTTVLGATPVTIPDEVPTVANPGRLLDHVPPVFISANVIVDPTQTVDGPVMGAGVLSTVTVVEEEQPVAINLYVIVAVPGEEPPKIPVVTPTGATPILFELQVPPGVTSLSVAVSPTHTCVGPVMAAGSGLTVNDSVDEQPLLVFEIVVLPAVTPVTTPVEEPIVATAGLLLDHVPPPVHANVMALPIHTESPLVIAPGVGFTVTS